MRLSGSRLDLSFGRSWVMGWTPPDGIYVP